MTSFFKHYLLPGLLFQSVIIGGGYSTGRELVEFFMRKGPLTGLIGMSAAMIIWSCVLALTFEYARVHKAYDYRAFFSTLLNRGWVLFELSFLAIALVALSIISAAAGAIFFDISGFPATAGSVLMMVGIGVLAFYGTALIERVFAFWSVVLYVAYASLFVIAFYRIGISLNSLESAQADNLVALRSGIEYAGVNLAVAPAILFGLRHIQCRRQAIWAGVIAGPIAMIPALLFYCVLLQFYPEIVSEEVPLLTLLRSLMLSEFSLVFQLVIFGTYIETGTAMVHSINERIAGLTQEHGRALARSHRVLVATAVLLCSVYLATKIGLVDLIAKGFGTLTYTMLAIYVLPLLTIGIMQIRNKSRV
jgi:uncharacterized membrane protein YkvI